jgi:MoaA/NifB/PqqE/SkfB family radical SAM enzyme
VRSLSSLLKYSFIYGRNYLLESLAVRFPEKCLLAPKPLYVGLSVGTVCNLRCRHCDLWKISKKAKDYLTFNQIRGILKEIREWLGPFRLVFTGAEPLVRKDILKIISFCSQNDIHTVLNSNAWLIDKKMVQDLIKSGLSVINISLDGAKAETHDSLRGRKGVYNRAVGALMLLTSAGKRNLSVNITTVIMRPNLDEIEDLVKLAKEKNVDGIQFQVLESKHLFGDQPYDPVWFKKNSLWPRKRRKLNLIVDRLISLKNKGYPVKNSLSELWALKAYYENPISFAKKEKYCFSGVRNFLITEYGKVKICFSMALVGDLLKESPGKIWFGDQAKKQRQEIARCRKPCRALLCNRREDARKVFNVFSKKLSSLIGQEQ